MSTDPRFIMADTFTVLRKAGIDDTEFSNEVFSAQSPREAISICAKWIDIANGKVSA